VFCLVLSALIVRTHIQQDDRYGFCMFRDLYTFQLNYYWVFDDGSQVEHDTSGDLKGLGRFIRQTRPGHIRDTILGIGCSRATISGFVDTMWEQRRRRGAIGFKAVLQHRRYDEGPWVAEVFEAP